ncbi:MAG TPA: hypothetical protein VFU47_11455, partial [Armatimonadota bacterium]|nr:hypothetical protein [Armatimonadota bacterium]
MARRRVWSLGALALVGAAVVAGGRGAMSKEAPGAFSVERGRQALEVKSPAAATILRYQFAGVPAGVPTPAV